MSALPELRPGAARIRASYLKLLLECVRRLPDAESAEILNRLGTHIAAVEDSTRVDWLPYEVPVAFLSTADGVLGREGLRALYLSATRFLLHGNLLAPLFSAFANLFELSPERMFRSAPAGFASIWRDAGDIGIKSVASGCVVLHHSPIPEVLRVSTFLEATAASFEALPVECGRSASSQVEFDGGDAARYIIRW